jgi:hypothetical protein
MKETRRRNCLIAWERRMKETRRRNCLIAVRTYNPDLELETPSLKEKEKGRKKRGWWVGKKKLLMALIWR